MATSTLGGYFAGSTLPALEPPGLLEGILRCCGIVDETVLNRWQAAYWRAKRPMAFRASAAAEPRTTQPARPPSARAADSAETTAVEQQAAEPYYYPVVSLRPPINRLVDEPALRGRDDLFAVLRTALAASDSGVDPTVHVLHGLGGCGKSRLALESAAESIAAGRRTWWLSAERPETLGAGMRALAAELGASPTLLHAGSLPDLVWDLLDKLADPWLVVVDDVDDPRAVLALPTGTVTDGTGWLRPGRGGLGRVIVTTRDGTSATWDAPPAPWLRRHHVPALDPADGAEVLLELTGPEAGSDTAAAAVAAQLGGLPLALKLAGHCLARAAEMPSRMAAVDGVVGFAAYSSALARGDFALLTADPANRGVPESRRSHAVLERTWEISLDLLSSRGLPTARPLLYALACLGTAPVPYASVLGNQAIARSPLFGGATMAEIWTALRDLAGFSLISQFPDQASDTEVLTIHPLVREISRFAAERGPEARLYLDAVTDMLYSALESMDPTEPAQWALWRLMAEHCVAPLDMLERSGPTWSPAHGTALDLAGRAADYLRASGFWEAAQTTYLRAIRVAARLPVDEPERVLELRHGIARVYYDKGLLAKAEQEFRAVLAERTERLGARHPDTLNTQHYLVRALRGRRSFREAMALCTATLAARREILGELHPDTLTSRNGVADLMRETGRTREARALYELVLSQRRDVLGERHPATLVTSHYLAMTDHDLDSLEAAERKFRELAIANAEVRGHEHPRTLAVGQSLVDVLHDLGRLDEAEQLALRLLAVRCRVLGQTHPAALVTRHRLGLILLDRGAFDAAEGELRVVVEDRRRVLGLQHPDTVMAEKDAAALRRQRSTQVR